MAKHRLNRIYCFPRMAKKESLEKHNKKEWSEKEDRDDLVFWDQKKREYLKENPILSVFFDELEEGAKAKAAEGEEDGIIEII